MRMKRRTDGDHGASDLHRRPRRLASDLSRHAVHEEAVGLSGVLVRRDPDGEEAVLVRDGRTTRCGPAGSGSGRPAPRGRTRRRAPASCAAAPGGERLLRARPRTPRRESPRGTTARTGRARASGTARSRARGRAAGRVEAGDGHVVEEVLEDALGRLPARARLVARHAAGRSPRPEPRPGSRNPASAVHAECVAASNVQNGT